ncbi:universal stress protein [Salsipaludibacter albus]|uniref:universal stress protein n=1 Tax=Salsipaludibacter albus TaxID=2849650 RepID=UPI001EE4AB39|nr:universal stress protein [Salsipaludibacter albus]MBY5163925.1 universal stress protein [Salsipaludibacter albus]
MGGRIVVGIDGSGTSVDALRRALDAARCADALLQIVHAYPWPPTGVASLHETWRRHRTREQAHHEALDVIEEALGDMVVDVDVDRIACAGDADAQLLRVARGADLLVVGSHGRGEVAGLLLGSTSLHVVSHAPCPVLVVPPGSTRGADRSDTAP